MAVFTLIDEAEAGAFASRYLPGPQVTALEPIAAGIENTNYRLDLLVRGRPLRLVLTVFEMLDESGLNPVVAFTRHLAAAGLPVPSPLAAPDGQVVGGLHGKPAVLVPFVVGRSLTDPLPRDCHAVAAALARIHLSGVDFPVRRAAVRNKDWLAATLAALQPRLPAADWNLLAADVAVQAGVAPGWSAVPGGWGHQDLFRDNVLFSAGRIAGIIDFYQACEEPYILDLAVLINDWCLDSGGGYDLHRVAAAVSGYESVRSLLATEKTLLPMALRLAALRFWLSRSVTWYGNGYQHHVKQGEVRKDPQEMARLSRHAASLPADFFQ